MSAPVTTEQAAPPATPAPDLTELKRKSVRGGVITFASQGVNVVIQLASTVILARLLTPRDYGVVAMVAAVTAFAGLFRDLGLSAAAIQKQTLTHAQQSNLFWVNVAMGAALTVLLSAASPLVAWFYGRPELQWVTVALSFNFLIGSFGAQSGALLVRQMRFGRQAVAGICGALVSLVVSVVLAVKGFRYWALVWGQLVGGVISTTLLFWLAPFRPGPPSRGTGLKSMVRFGAHITAFDVVNYLHRNLDKILIGRVWGADALGLYSRAYALLMFLIANLRGPINAVAFPAMSRLQNNPEAFRAYYRRITTILAFVSMPFSAFLFLEARPIVELALGDRWEGIVPIFSILALVSFVQPVVTLWGVVMLSAGMGRRYLWLGVLNSLACTGGFLVGVHWGPLGVAAGYAAATYLSMFPLLFSAFRGTALTVLDFLTSVSRSTLASLLAVCVCALTLDYVTGSLKVAVDIAIKALAFGTVYLGVLYILPEGKNVLKEMTMHLFGFFRGS